MNSFLICLLLVDGSLLQEPPATVAKALITDLHGQPVPEELPLGEAVVFSAKTSIHGADPKSVKWIILPPERDARKFVTDDGLQVFVPTGLKPVEITVLLSVAKGDTVDAMMLKVKCGEGDIPPPDPKPDPNPKPQPDPTPSGNHKLTLYIVEDPTQITADSAIIKNSTAYWDGLISRGHTYRFLDKRSTEPGAADVISLAGTSLPALVLRDTDVSKFLGASPLPKTTKDIDTLLRKYTTR